MDATPTPRKTGQPIPYPPRYEYVEPDWTRIPGYRGVSAQDWENAIWQRKHTIKNLGSSRRRWATPAQSLADSIAKDQELRATMSMLLPPQMLNTMNVADLWNDPVRRYMLPAFAGPADRVGQSPARLPGQPARADMWVVEGLTHRYPTKVLAELLSTCPQYCGHCTRMDLVGNDVPRGREAQVPHPPEGPAQQMLDYLRKTPAVRDVVVSGGDIANLHISQLEPFVSALMESPTSGTSGWHPRG